MVGKTLSHYKIISELGRGGMGVVYKAEDTKLDRIVAIKVLPAAALSSEDDRARFYREAKAAAALNHPHIAAIHQIDEAVPEGEPSDELRPFIAMEYIEGGTLEARIKDGPFKLEEAVRIATQVADALKAAHAKDIVHRDIKSANIMLTEDGQAKVLDFGLAQTAASTKLTRMGSTLGTVAYMSPEQARGEVVDARTDIWALGVTLYEMVAGAHPFGGDYEQAVVYSILNEDPHPLTAIRTGVPMGLEWIINKMLAKKAEHRYQSSTEVIVDLATVDLSGVGLSRVSSASTTVATGAASFHPTSPSKGSLVESARQAWIPLIIIALIASGIGYVASSSLNPQERPIARTLPLSIPAIKRIEDPTLSPDGTRIAFQGADSSGRAGIFEYELTGDHDLIHYPGSQSGSEPAYSPDGRFLTYQGDEEGLPVHAVPGGAQRLILTGSYFYGPKWTSNERIVVQQRPNLGSWIDNDYSSSVLDRPIISVDVSDGNFEILSVPDSSRGHGSMILTSVSWDKRYGLVHLFPISDEGVGDLALLDLQSGEYEVIKTGAAYGYFLGKRYIVYTQSSSSSILDPGAIVVQEFDWSSRSLTGSFVQLIERSPGFAIEVSDDGSLLHSQVVADLSTFDIMRGTPEGGEMVLVRRVPSLTRPVTSPDGSMIAKLEGGGFVGPFNEIKVYSADGILDISVVSEDTLLSPAWSHDGSTIYYGVQSDGGASIKSRPVNLSRAARVEMEDAWYPEISPDGEHLAFSRMSSLGQPIGLYVKDLRTQDIVALDSTSVIDEKSFSPDARYIAYHTEDGPSSRVVVRSLDGSFTQILVDGKGPQWAPTDDYIYFRSPTPANYFRRIAISTDPIFSPTGNPETLLTSSWGSFWHIDFANNLVYEVPATKIDLKGPDAVLNLTLNLEQLVDEMFE